MEMQEIKDFYSVVGAGRKSKYSNAKEILEEMYNNKEKVEVSVLAKQLSVTYNTAKNYLFRFLKEELNIEMDGKVYNYKR